MKRRKFLKTTGAAGIISLIHTSGIFSSFARPPLNDPSHSFLHPPQDALPQTLWFWMNGHIKKEGITLDLEAIKRAGLGGVFNFDAGIGIPRGPVDYLSAEWTELKKHAMRECARLGLDFTMHNCPGWSSSGGPWITPEKAMQQFTWSEMVVAGGAPVRIRMPLPFHKLNYYKDVSVVVFPSLEGEEQYLDVDVHVNGSRVDKKLLTGEEGNGLIIAAQDNTPGHMDLYFTDPFVSRSVTFLIASPPGQKPVDGGKRTSVLLEASEDGSQYGPVATINTGSEYELSLGDKFITFDLPLTTAKYFRLTCTEARRIAQFRLSSVQRINRFLEKTGTRYFFDGENISVVLNRVTQEMSRRSIIDIEKVYDLTSNMDADGHLEWTPPPGNWTLLRFGYTPSGSVTKAAPATGIGLECDKFSADAIDYHFQKMMEPLLPLMNQLKGKWALEIDSYEAGPQTWTREFPQAFMQSRKYNMTHYLPALTGRAIQSVETTERFLWDFRRTQADLIADNYYGRFHALCKQHGLDSYTEPYDKGPFEEMQIGARSGSVMGEFWNGLSSILQGNYAIRRTTKLAASISHINGFKITGAESYTSEPGSAKWQEYPFALKPLGDKMFCRGLNRMVMHRFAHQPHPSAAPGMTMGPWGIQFDRTNTWFDKGKEWMDYLSRTQSLLQYGTFIADFLYFTGQEVNCYTRVEREDLHPMPPQGYDYDLVNSEVIMEEMRIENGNIILKSGMRYRLLVLQDFKGLSLPLLKRLYQLVKEGMIVVGSKPDHSLGLKDFQENDATFHQIANELWGKGTTKNSLGKGAVYPADQLPSILKELHIKPDFEYSSESGDAGIEYIHRRTGNTEIYFISNQGRSYESLVCSFRVKGKQPEIWDAVARTMIQQTVFEITGDRTRMPVQLPPYGSVFVVFRFNAFTRHLVSIEKDGTAIMHTNDFIPSPIKKSGANNFTLLLWAKPEVEVMTVPSVHMGNLKYPWTEYFAVFPSTGKELYGDGHSCSGIAIGRNGVVVWENAEGHPLPVLTASTPIQGWTHIAVSYNDGIPSVYVGGKLVTVGKKSNHEVHLPFPTSYATRASYYNGDRTDPEFFDHALTSEEMETRSKSNADFFQCSPVKVEPAAVKGQPALLIHRNGRYKMKFNSGAENAFVVAGIDDPVEIKGPWLLNFPPSSGAPANIELPSLISLHHHENSGVRYFSGTVQYKKEFILSPLKNGYRLLLDLGRVEVMASISINGKYLGLLWTRPYRIDITDAAREGRNELSVSVTNLWPNRLIGDEQFPDPDIFRLTAADGFEQLAGDPGLGAPILELPGWYTDGAPKPNDGRIAFTTWKHYHKNDPLLESGLIGPVMLHTVFVKSLSSIG